MTTDRESDEIQAIKRLSEHASAAYSRGDVETLLECWDAKECIYMLPGEPLRSGRDSIRQSYEATFAQFDAELPPPEEIVSVSGDMAFGRFTSTVTLTPKGGGAPVRNDWKGVHIYRRQPDGGWKYRLVIGNSSTPPG